MQVSLTAGFAAVTTALFAVSVTGWTPLTFLALVLVLLSAIWISGGAATALLGVSQPSERSATPPADWTPVRKTAILVTVCGEDSSPIAAYLGSLRRTLSRSVVGAETSIWVLSDTSGAERVGAEEAALRPLIDEGLINYRRRPENHGLKPGNIADWVRRFGEDFDFMLVLDADSRMSAQRIEAMIWKLENEPGIGLLQAGISLVPGQTRFGRHQRLSARLLSPNFLRGFAAWCGNAGNYWGHNALIRLSAFRAALNLPVLPGKAPFGGAVLSHDFIEAAWIRRAGWTVVVEPDLSGSSENAPQTMEDFHRRDRRWCQGNLQHLRLLAEPGLHPVSRLHLGLGIVSYLAAPIWMSLIILIASGAVRLDGALPLLPIVLLLLMPKICALPHRMSGARTLRRRVIVLRAFGAELVLSTLLAPLVMLRQTSAVLAVLLGRDCGWKRTVQSRRALPAGAIEAAVGLGLCSLVVMAGTMSALWLVPLILPLLAAPLIVPAMDAPL